MQGKPAVGAERTVSASHGQGDLGRVDAPLALDWDDLVQFVQSPKQSDVTHSYYFSLPKNRPKGAPAGTPTQSALKTDDEFVLFGVCKDGKRNDANLLSRSAITLDYDQPDALGLMRRLRLESLSIPFAYVWHTTRSHDVNLVADRVQPKLRIIVPLSRDVTAAEYHLLVKALARMFPATVDESAFRPVQIMFCPIHNQGAPYRCGAFRGRGYLEPDSVLAFIDEDEAEAAQASGKRRSLATRDADGGYDPLVNAEPPMRGIDIEAAAEYLDRIDSDDQDKWLQVGRALHHQFGGSDEALDLWDEWSARSDKYVDGEPAEKWARFKVSPHQKPTRFATIMMLAGDADAEEATKAFDRYTFTIDNCNDRLKLEKTIPREIGGDKLMTGLLRKALIVQLQKRQKVLFNVSLSLKEMNDAMAVNSAAAVTSAVPGVRAPYTDLGLAERLYDAIGENVIFDPKMGRWYRWTEKRWKPLAVQIIQRAATMVVKHLDDELDDRMTQDQRREHLAFCMLAQSARSLNAMVSLLHTVEGSNMIVETEKLDSDMSLLGVRNGVVDLKTGELHDANREDYITRVTACDYDPDAQCPLFERVVSDAFYDDPVMIDWFQRVIGYALLGNPKEQFFVIPYGLGSNGKSTILNAVRNALGQHACSTPYTTFLTDGKTGVAANGPQEHVLRLKGARFVYMSEPESGMQLRTSLIKSVTGGDELTARGVHAKESVAFKPTWVIFMPTNHKPNIRDVDHGIWRRIKLVPFERNFDEDPDIEKDTELDEKLKAEQEGILAWCVAGATKYLCDGLGKEPDSIRNAHDAYKTEMDVLHEWLEDHWIMEPLAFTSTSELYASWEKYTQRNGIERAGSSRWLSMKLQERGLRPAKQRGIRGYKGITRTARSAGDEGFED
jgi:putative DNA primase/helicase